MMSVFNRALLLGAFLSSLVACDSSVNESDNKDKSSAKLESGAVQTREQKNDKAKLAQREKVIEQALVGSRFEQSSAPAANEYRNVVAKTLASESPVLALDDLKDSRAIEAQKLFLNDPRLAQSLFHAVSKEPLRNEVMAVKPALPGDRVGKAKDCQLGECYRVDIYNFFYNVTVTGIVDILTGQVLTISSLPETQPDLSPRLEQLAEAIAKHEPLVQAEVARYLESVDQADSAKQPLPVMVSTKSALKNSLCERSRHLCVAPTYVLGNQALWVIVDLSDYKVAGVRWTTVGDSGPPTIITERKLENEYVYKNFCEQTNALQRNGWTFEYHLTSSDGLRVAGVTFNSRPVFDSAKVVDWHVSYSRSDQFGYSDATGCPMFSSAVVVAYDGPKVEPILEEGVEVGFALSQDFRQLPWPAACNYRYQERYEFYNDGRYRIAVSNHGRGCGINGTYRPVLRIDLGKTTAIEQWQETRWDEIESESWSQQAATEKLQERKYSHRFVNASGTYLLAPSIGAFGDGGRGDNAFIYTTVKHADKDEGDSDLVTLGSCCNDDYRQGPEQFMEPPEPLDDQALILWYVPQIENDGAKGSEYCWADTQVVDGVAQTKTWPCTAGPMFVPARMEPADD